MNAKLRVNINEQMNMVRHNFQINKFNLKLLRHRRNKLLETYSNSINQNLSAVLRTPNDMIFAGIYDIMIRFILHVCIIQKV